jgi:hypothetical protein
MAQLKQSAIQRLGKRWTMILPVAQFCQTAQHRRVVAGIALFQSLDSSCQCDKLGG